jgi:hypothetical protein
MYKYLGDSGAKKVTINANVEKLIVKIWNHSQFFEMNLKYKDKKIMVEPSAMRRTVPTVVCHFFGTSSKR